MNEAFQVKGIFCDRPYRVPTLIILTFPSPAVLLCCVFGAVFDTTFSILPSVSFYLLEIGFAKKKTTPPQTLTFPPAIPFPLVFDCAKRLQDLKDVLKRIEDDWPASMTRSVDC